MAAPVYFTAELVRNMPDDGNRYEVVHGELLVTPAPRLVHQRVLRHIFVALDAYLKRVSVGELFCSPADISWTSDSLVQPDLFVVPLTESQGGEWSSIRTLLLAVEILSPSSAHADRFTKRRLYQEVGVRTYWIVDADAKVVEHWTPDAITPRVERERLVWEPDTAVPPLTLELATLFG